MGTKYTKEILTEAAKNSSSVMGVIRYLGLRQAGGTHSHISRMLKKHSIDISHFTGRAHNKGKTAYNKQSADEILVRLPAGSARQKTEKLRRALKDIGVVEECSCGLTDEWQGKKLRLEVDHIDGDFLNNLRDNLRFICPNCHSQEISTNRSWKYTR